MEPSVGREEQQTPRADSILEFASAPGADVGAVCALLTPLVKSRLRELRVGQVLEIRVDDSTAREDMASWCRLSGHELVAATEDSAHRVRMFVRKAHA